MSHCDLRETKRHLLGPGDLPDLGGFAAANDLVGKSDVEVRATAYAAALDEFD